MTTAELNDPVKTAWDPLLQDAGATRAGDRVSRVEENHSGNTGARVTPLLDRAWLAFRGDDAAGFLHDQLTAGVDDLDGSAMRLAAYCNAQGRVLALMRVILADDAVQVELPASLAESIAGRLTMFVLRADVRIERQPHLTALGLWGPDAPGLLEKSSLPVPVRAFDRVAEKGLGVTRLPAPEPRFQLTGDVDAVTGFWRDWADRAAPASTDAWRALDVSSGLPDVYPATSDRILPQSLNLEAWNALSFRKGCYPGQEVIARLHFRGRLKRHLYRAAIAGDPPEPGTAVHDGNDRDVGIIVSSAPDADGRGGVVLAVLHEEAGECHLAGEPKRALTGPERLVDTAPT